MEGRGWVGAEISKNGKNAETYVDFMHKIETPTIDFMHKIETYFIEDKFARLQDDEFARQTVAWVNPVSIEKLEVFQPLVREVNASSIYTRQGRRVGGALWNRSKAIPRSHQL
ncbi:hypothetical protein LguiB_032409 [Lonicera macranthoides]